MYGRHGREIAKYLAFAGESRNRAANARKSADEEAWFALAEKWLRLARDANDEASARLPQEGLAVPELPPTGREGRARYYAVAASGILPKYATHR